MREAFYIELERREKAKKEWEEKMYDDPDFDYEGMHNGGFEPLNFPKRECKPIVRTRSREQVRRMINGH